MKRVEKKMQAQFHSLILRLLDIACTEPFGPFLELVENSSESMGEEELEMETDAARHNRETRAHLETSFVAIERLCAMHTAT